MAVIVLQAAGAFFGGLFGPVGAVLGKAAGAMAGYVIDRSLIESTRRIEGPRLRTSRPFMAEEGVPLARIYGTIRVSGDLIWATRFEETRSTSRQGGKGGPKVTTYSYFCNAAFALCEGEIAGVRRIWADGREVDLEGVTIRIHRGTADQPVDPLIAAKQGAGNAPAYRGLAYAVLDRFPLEAYGNRIPQLQFEVMRPVGQLNRDIRSVALLPGSTEYGLSPRPVTRMPRLGETEQINRTVLHGPSDLVASLDELQALCPDLEEVAVIVTWFGDDLRAGRCRLRPMVTDRAAAFYTHAWSVSGQTRSSAAMVSLNDGASSYGGTPSDRSVIDCIAEIRRRGLRVALYPFIMMDVPDGNDLPDPYGGVSQPPFPWRGRITCDPAPGTAGSADASAAARAQVAAFCGSVVPGHFSATGGMVHYSGPAADWGYRRLVLHYARLAAVAGGVDTFLLGSELRGLTTLRDDANAFPFVEALGHLAGEVRAMLGGETAITYGADWTEYFGHHPADGSGDVFFHLDPLWAHPAITAVGIDNYTPLSDWRDADYAGGNPDGFGEPYDGEGLRAQITGGEGFDWYYADHAARMERTRVPITDGAYGKPWVFRFKDIRSWWENEHFERVGGIEMPEPTAWQPCSKPIWFTELGCPAVDKGPNQPNVFPDAKSSEDAVPYFSSGARSDLAQSRFLEAHLDHWNTDGERYREGSNPVSPVYGGPMVDFSRICIWAWDARPFPAFPAARSKWKDGDNWQCGHWLNGRLSSVSGSDLVAAILTDHGVAGADVKRVGSGAAGYAIDTPTTARAALEPFAALHGLVAVDENGVLTFRDEAAAGAPPVLIGEMVVDPGGSVIEHTRLPDTELPRTAELGFADPFQEYQSSVARVAPPGLPEGRDEVLAFPGSLEAGAAAALADDWVTRRRAGRDGVTFAVPAAALDVAPGSLVELPGAGDFMVTQVDLGMARQVVARRIVRAAPSPWRISGPAREIVPPAIAGPPLVAFMDLPLLPGASGDAAFADQFRIAAYASPWHSQAVYNSPEETGFNRTAMLPFSAIMGELVDDAPAGHEGRIDLGRSVTVALRGGALSSVSTIQMLNGANIAAILSAAGIWEVVQFREATEIAPSVWRLGGLLRGQGGTGDALLAGSPAGATFVLLDEAVVKAGLSPDQASLLLNWRVGPAGEDFGSPNFVQIAAEGGVRSRLPLSPVHLRIRRLADGGAEFGWIRRGRIDADSWLGEEIPLGEESERYRVEILTAEGTVRRTVETTEPRWLYPAAWASADFPSRPASIGVSVRQISASVGAGPARHGDFLLTT